MRFCRSRRADDRPVVLTRPGGASQPSSPWGGVGFGYESFAGTVDTDDFSNRGIEVGHVQLGADYRVVALGAFRTGLIETQIGMVLPRWAVEFAQERPGAAVGLHR